MRIIEIHPVPFWKKATYQFHVEALAIYQKKQKKHETSLWSNGNLVISFGASVLRVF